MRPLVLEALALHEVAPVARGGADGEEDWLVLAAGGLEGVVAPGTADQGIFVR